MNRQKLLVIAIVPVLAALTLSACNRTAPAGAEGGLVTAPAATEQTGTMPAPAPDVVAAPAPVETAPAGPVVEYADVTNVKAVTVKETQYGTVTKSQELTQNSTAPREVCEDVTVQERLPERDGNAGGTVAGAVVGGVLGNQVGKGDGRTAATLAGVVIGAMIGNKVASNNDRPDNTSYRENNGTVRRCREVGGYNEYGNNGYRDGYNVTYRYAGRTYETVTRDNPGRSLPIVVDVMPRDGGNYRR